jgi:hypothetical protein
MGCFRPIVCARMTLPHLIASLDPDLIASHNFTSLLVRALHVRDLHVVVPNVTNYKDISMTDKAICDTYWW